MRTTDASKLEKRNKERKEDKLKKENTGPKPFPPHIFRYRAGTPDQHRQANRLYRRMRIGAAQRDLSRNNGKRLLAPGYARDTGASWLRGYHGTILLEGAHVCYKGYDGLRWLGKNRAGTTEDKVYLVPFLNDSRPIKTSSPFGALHDFDRGRTRLLVPAASHHQRVSAEDPT